MTRRHDVVEPLILDMNYGKAEALVRSLAREVAQGLNDTETILQNHRITPELYSKITKSPRFQAYLQQEISNWAGSMNTLERIKLKTQAMVEDLLPEMHQRMHSKSETLTSKVELLKTLMKAGGIGAQDREAGGAAGDKVTIQINMGNDQVKVTRDVTPQSNLLELSAEDM